MNTLSPRPKTSIGVIFMVLFLDLVGFSIMWPLYADILQHYGQQQSGLLATVMAWVAERYPDATLQQR
jgi:hypothetical protein